LDDFIFEDRKIVEERRDLEEDEKKLIGVFFVKGFREITDIRWRGVCSIILGESGKKNFLPNHQVKYGSKIFIFLGKSDSIDFTIYSHTLFNFES